MNIMQMDVSLYYYFSKNVNNTAGILGTRDYLLLTIYYLL